MVKDGLVLVAGVGTALVSYSLIGNTYFKDQLTQTNAQIHVEQNWASQGSKASSYSDQDNTYIYVKTTVLDLAQDVLNVSRDFSAEESEGYGKFVDQFFS